MLSKKFWRESKKFFMTLCIAAVAIFISGCGSDNSDKVNSSAQKNSSAVKTGLLNVNDFIRQYNAALDTLGNRFDKISARTIIFHCPKIISSTCSTQILRILI